MRFFFPDRRVTASCALAAISLAAALPAHAQLRPRADWAVQGTQAQDSAQQTEAQAPVEAAADTVSASATLLALDRALADRIFDEGPLAGYGGSLSAEGILYDASGPSPAGQAAAANRFGSFPADVKLERRPEKAIADGASGSTWGSYAVKRGGNVLSQGRYITVWRREEAGWRIVSELAAGRTGQPAAATLPPRAPVPGAGAPRPNPGLRDALGRPIPAAPAPVEPPAPQPAG